jgi:hypothetical protein
MSDADREFANDFVDLFIPTVTAFRSSGLNVDLKTIVDTVLAKMCMKDNDYEEILRNYYAFNDDLVSTKHH